MNIHSRLKELRIKKELSLEDVAAGIGVSWQTIQQWENGKTAPKRNRLDQVAEFYGVSVNFLLNGTEIVDGFVLIRSVDQKLSAGVGNIVTHDDESKMLSFRTAYLKSKGVKTENALAFKVDGDSMIDVHILPGATVVVDENRKTPRNHKYYAIWIDDHYYIKELVLEGNTWMAKSHNKDKASKYPDIPITSEHSGIVGQAFWCGFEL